MRGARDSDVPWGRVSHALVVHPDVPATVTAVVLEVGDAAGGLQEAAGPMTLRTQVVGHGICAVAQRPSIVRTAKNHDLSAN